MRFLSPAATKLTWQRKTRSTSSTARRCSFRLQAGPHELWRSRKFYPWMNVSTGSSLSLGTWLFFACAASSKVRVRRNRTDLLAGLPWRSRKYGRVASGMATSCADERQMRWELDRRPAEPKCGERGRSIAWDGGGAQGEGAHPGSLVNIRSPLHMTSECTLQSSVFLVSGRSGSSAPG